MRFLELKLENGERLLIFRGNARSIREAKTDPEELRNAIALFEGYYENGNLYNISQKVNFDIHKGFIDIEETIEIPPSDKITLDYLKDSWRHYFKTMEC